MRDYDTVQAEKQASARADKFFNEQMRADVQQVMNLPGMRRILFTFMQHMGADSSAFATNAMAQSHAIGLQDAAKWWQALIREHCPEKEAQIRSEGIANSKKQPEPEGSDE